MLEPDPLANEDVEVDENSSISDLDERWDATFDTTKTTGLEVFSDTTELSRVSPGSQAEKLGILANGKTFIVSVGGNPTFDRGDVAKELQRCRSGPSKSVVITFSTKAQIPLPLWKPLWMAVVCLVHWVPMPNGPNLLTGANGNFLGLFKPAKVCSTPCCYFCCLRVFSLPTAVCMLALLQIVGALSLLVSHAAHKNITEMAEQVIDIGLALFVLKGVEMRQPLPIAEFAFLQLLLASTEISAAIIALFYLRFDITIGSVIEATYKTYYSWVAWSLAKEFGSAQEEIQESNIDNPCSTVRPSRAHAPVRKHNGALMERVPTEENGVP